MPHEIKNDDLSVHDIPPADRENQQEIKEFALTFDGYEYWGSFDACADVANRWLQTWQKKRELPDSLTDLRTCLFFEQRRWNHFGHELDQEAQLYIIALVNAIRAKVQNNDRG